MILKMNPSILLDSGNYFHYFDLKSNVYTIRDIALGLSNTCRYSGQIKDFYSVAQHSVICSQIVPREYALDALLHDGSEAFMSDLATPLKQLLPEYKKIEDSVQSEIYSRFGINSMAQVVKDADRVCLATEKRDLLVETDVEWEILKGFTPLEEKIIPLEPKEAFQLFVDRYTEIINEED